MSDSTRIVLAATVISTAVGIGAGCLALLANHPPRDASVIPILGSAIFIATLASLPISLPTGIAGGLVAAWASRRYARLSPEWWLSLGTISGGLLGAAGAMLWFGALSVDSSDFGGVLLMAAAVGAVPGFVVGAAVGAYCARLGSTHTP
jgi:hypothetical protein